jgi:ferredoxin
MPKVVFVNEKREIEVPVGANLRDEARKAGVILYPGMTRYLNCLGHGTCGTCKVLVKKGGENLSPKGLMEKMTLMRSLAVVGNENELRLACQVKVLGDVSVETRPTFNWSGENFWQKPYPNK